MLTDVVTKQSWECHIRNGFLNTSWNKRFEWHERIGDSKPAFKLKIFHSGLESFNKRLMELSRKPKIFHLKEDEQFGATPKIDVFVKIEVINKSRSVWATRKGLKANDPENYYSNITIIVVPVNNLEVLSYINKQVPTEKK